MKNKQSQKLIRSQRAIMEAVEPRRLMTGTPIALDPTFGSAGIVVDQEASVGPAFSTANDPTTGDTIVAGMVDGNYFSSPLELQRYSSTGVLLTSFGVSGTLTTNQVGFPVNMTVQPDGKILVLSKVSDGQGLSTLSRFSATGSVDTTFGTAGSVTYAIGTTPFEPSSETSLIIESNGEIVLAGTYTSGTNSTGALIALTSSGLPDKSFGSQGVAIGVAGSLNTLAVDSAGNLLAVGSTSITGSSPANAVGAGEVKRFTSAGQLDTTFGSSGTTIASNASSFDAVHSSSTGIAVYGQLETYSDTDGLAFTNEVNHFTSTGHVDTTFGSGSGYVSVTSNINPAQIQPTFQPDGKLLVAGNIDPTPGSNVASVARFNTDGSLDATFGNGGYAVLGAGYNTAASAGGVSLQADGKIVLTHSTSDSDAGITGADFDPTRLTVTGLPDTTFGPSGTAVGRPLFNSGDKLVSLSNGDSLIAGELEVAGEQGLYIRRYNPNGSIDSTFGGGSGIGGASGYVLLGTVGSGAMLGSVTDLAVDSTGRILIGQTGVGITRYISAGVLDTTFGTGGTKAIGGLVNFRVESNELIVATSGSSTVTRLTSQGSVDTTFGSNGSMTSPIVFGLPPAMAFQTNGELLLGGGSPQLEVTRITTAGTVDPSFGANGIATADFTPFDTTRDPGAEDFSPATALAQLPNGNIVAAAADQLEGPDIVSAVVAEFLPTGQLNTAFASNGLAAPNFPAVGSAIPNSTTVVSLIVEPDGHLIIAGSVRDTGGSNQQDQSSFYLLRYDSTGVIDGTINTQLNPAQQQGGPYAGILNAVAGPNGTVSVVGFANASLPVTGEGFALARYIVNATGMVSGTVYSDKNGDGKHQTGESGLGGVVVYADLNNDSTYENGEPVTTTSSSGSYTLNNVSFGAVVIRQVLAAGAKQTYPVPNYGQHVTISATPATGADFETVVPPAGGSISGTVTANGAALSGETVYLDANNNSSLDDSEIFTTTSSTGSYSFSNVPVGAYIIRQLLPSRYTQNSPALGYGIHVTVTNGSSTTGNNFLDSPPASAKLTGTLDSTAGSYNNLGNTAGKAFDGILTNYFDGPTANGDYVGLDLGSAKLIAQIGYAPRGGYSSRMVGGIFQGSNHANFLNAGTLFTVTAAPPNAVLTLVTVTNTQAFRYVRYLAPNGSYGDVGEVVFYGLASAIPVKLTGTTIGTAGSFANNGNTIAKAVDGSRTTFFDGPDSAGDWVGLDLGLAQVVTQVKFAPRAGYESRMVGGELQGSTTANFSSGVVTLFTISTQPTAGRLTIQPLANSTAYEFYRYLGPASSHGDIAEIEFDG